MRIQRTQGWFHDCSDCTSLRAGIGSVIDPDEDADRRWIRYLEAWRIGVGIGGGLCPDQQPETAAKRTSFLHSERDHRDTGNGLEVAHIAGGNAVAKFQRRDPDQQVGEWQSDALGRALTVDLPSPESDRS